MTRFNVLQVSAVGSVLLLCITRQVSGKPAVTLTRVVIAFVAVVLMLTTWRLTRGWWWVPGGVVLALSGLACLVMVDGFIGDLLDKLKKPQPAKISIRWSINPSLGTVVYFPGAINSAEITSEGFRSELLTDMDVVLVEHPGRDWNKSVILPQVLQFLSANKLSKLYFIGQSFGTEVAINFIRYYESNGSPLGPVGGRFVSVCGPTDVNDVKAFPPITWARYIKGGPILNSVWPGLQIAFGKLGPKQTAAPGVSEDWVKRHQHYMHHRHVRAAFAQFAELARNRAPEPGEFDHITALIFRTQGEDVFVRHQAADKLLAAFSAGSRVVTVPGIHANLVEEAPSYSHPIADFILEGARISL